MSNRRVSGDEKEVLRLQKENERIKQQASDTANGYQQRVANQIQIINRLQKDMEKLQMASIGLRAALTHVLLSMEANGEGDIEVSSDLPQEEFLRLRVKYDENETLRVWLADKEEGPADGE